MRKFTGSICALALLSALFIAPSIAVAQADDEGIYTYVAQWRLDRDKRAAFWDQFEKNTQPTLEKLAADDTIVEWGTSHQTVHTADGMTDMMWWCAKSIAGTQKVLQELMKSPMESVPGAMLGHSDMMLKSMIFRSKGGITEGYLQVANYTVKPGKGAEWLKLWKKYALPEYEKMMADGVIHGFGVDREYIHTANPRMRSVWVMTKDAESLDKENAAWDAIFEQASEEMSQAIGRSFRDVLEGDAHRDSLEYVSRFHHK
jgi:hypothetical protein